MPPPTVNRLKHDQVQALRRLGRTSPQEEGCCPICQQDWVEIHEPKVNLGCAHSLCSSCFQEASYRGLRNCPICRKDLRHLIAPNNDLRRVDDLQDEHEAAEVMIGMGTNLEEQRHILMMSQRQPPHDLVILPEEGDDDELPLSAADHVRTGVIRFIHYIRTPLTPV